MVNWENYEEYMLMQVDGELTEAEEIALFEFIRQHPGLAEELNSFQEVRLIPDNTIVFNGKDSLLKPTKEPRVISFRQWRVYAAAAGFLLVLFVSALLLRNAPVRQLQQPSVAVQAPQTPQTTHTEPQVVKSTAVVPVTTEPVPDKPRHQPRLQEQPLEERNPEYIARLDPQVRSLEVVPVADLVAPLPLEDLASHELIAYKEPERKEPLPWLLVKEEKRVALKQLSNSLNNKVEQAKDIRESFKEATLAVRFGNKELILNF